MAPRGGASVTAQTATAAGSPYIGITRHVADDLVRDGADGLILEAAGRTRLLRLASVTRLRQRLVSTNAGERPCWYAIVESPVVETDQAFDSAIASWNALTPPGTWLQVDVRARLGDGRWTRYYAMAVWASGLETISRHSVGGQDDDDAHIATDTLQLRTATGRAFQYRLTLFAADARSSPSVQSVSVVTSDSRHEPPGQALASDGHVWGTELSVPGRSQRVEGSTAAGWCSPTATAMVLAYWGHDVAVPEAAAATYDYVYEGTGNWAFNTAWAATYGLEAFVARLASLVQVEMWIRAGAPVIISLAFGQGELPGAPIASSDGHLIVVRGFDPAGDVIVNDPAGRADGDVRRVYARDTLEALWLRSSGGTAYLIHPPGLDVPVGSSGNH